MRSVIRTVVAAGMSWALCVSPAAAGQYDGFRAYADSGSLRPFCRDLGGILGSATFHGGRSLGFSGFDVGLRGGAQLRPDPNDRILRRNGVDAFGLPWLQAEVGMPFRLDGFVRGTGWQGLSVAGGGLRYGLLKSSDEPWTPQLLVSGVGHAVVHRDFSASHYGAGFVGSMGIPVFTPYLGVGFDRTRLLVRSSLLDPTLDGKSVDTTESRFTAGMRFRPWTFFYLNLAYVLVHRENGAEVGLGIRF